MAYFEIPIVINYLIRSTELINRIFYEWGYEFELDKLKKTIIAVKAVLDDAEAKRDLLMVQRDYISELKAAVYDADDLFDEFFTLAKLREIDGFRGGKFSNKVSRFLCSNKNNKFSQAKQMSRRVKKIRKQLDTITDDYKKSGLSIDYTPIVRRWEKTCSYVDVKDIIGRDSDKKAILDVLLDPSATDDFCFLTIVGVGGLGKTALAQLLYNDENIRNEFLLSWVCVSDHDGCQFDVKTILCEILESSLNRRQLEHINSSLVQEKFQEQISGKKYFLVLDDLWNEDYVKWKELEKYLRMGQRGSMIVVTTRSLKTASIIGSKHVHELQGLSRKDSLRLFEMTAFKERENDPELVEMGKSIVKKCYNNPLAIKVVGNLLKGQEKSMWESIEKSGLGEISKARNMIFPTVKLSYYNLTPSLKSCFSYCALFPKDFDMDKEMLINLWLAQGYIVSLEGGQSVEDAAENFFFILLQRGFFKDVKENKWGDIKSVKLHDLMYDVAKEVAKEEICVATSDQTENIGQKIRHLYVENTDQRDLMFRDPTKIRSYFSEHLIYKQLENMTALRILVVNSPSRILVSFLEKLLLLRFLKLSDHSLVNLPASFTRLNNLQTLYLSCRSLIELPKDFSNLINLRHFVLSCDSLKELPKDFSNLIDLRHFVLSCDSLKELPKDFSNLIDLRHFVLSCDSLKELPEDFSNLINLRHLVLSCSILIELPKDFSNLINLRHLDISHCRSLISMPLDMDKLTNLRVLSKFVRGYRDPNNVELIETLTEIKDDMHVKIGEIYENVEGMSGTEEDSLKNMKHLTEVIIKFEDKCIAPERVLKNVLPSPKLKSLTLQCYNGTTIPWSKVSFPHTLVHIEIKQFRNLERLPVLSKLPHLKSLVLNLLNGVEYLEEVIDNYYWHTEEVEEFFPSLESLEIKWMFKLKGWWKRNQKAKRFNAFPRLSFLSMAFCGNFASVSSENLPELQLPCLRELHIERCGKFVSNLVCPRLEKLKMDKINEKLLIICENSQVDAVIKSRVSDLKSLHTNCLTGLTISNCIDWEVKNFSEFKEEFEKSCCSSLLTLAIENCELRRLSGLEHLTVLQELTLDCNQKLIINEDDEEPWKSFHRSLRKLKFSSLTRMKSLPKGMQHLNFLEHLVLQDCKNLEGLPQWLSCLSSLESMEIYDCPGIKSFPEAIKDLISLNSLSISGCPDLENRCKNSRDSERIKHIKIISYVAKPSREEFVAKRC